MPGSSQTGSRRRSSDELDVGRIVVFLGGAVAAAIGSWLLAPDFGKSADALAAAAGVCATFAGFIVAVLTILGDASALLPGSWRLASIQNREIAARFQRLQFIFVVFLCATFSSLVAIAFEDVDEHWTWFVRYLATFTVAYAFFTSFELPRALKSIREERAAAVIEARKKEAAGE